MCEEPRPLFHAVGPFSPGGPWEQGRWGEGSWWVELFGRVQEPRLGCSLYRELEKLPQERPDLLGACAAWVSAIEVIPVKGRSGAQQEEDPGPQELKGPPSALLPALLHWEPGLWSQ